MAAVKVDRNKAKGLLVQIGMKTATKFSDARLLATLTQLDQEDDTVDAGKYKKLYSRIVKANEEEKEFELVGEKEPAKGKTTKTKAPAKGTKGKTKAPAKGTKGKTKGTKGKTEKAKPSSNGVGGRGRDKNGYCSKDYVYMAWQKAGDDDTSDDILEASGVGEKVKIGTVRNWISGWASGRKPAPVGCREE